MELPPYRVPMMKSLLIHMWDRGKIFLKKMGGIILVGSIVVWVLATFPRTIEFDSDYEAKTNKVNASYQAEISNADKITVQALEKQRATAILKISNAQKMEATEKSFLGSLGKLIAPVFAPIGVDWRGGVALLTGFVAKEIVVSTLGVLYSVEEEAESGALKQALLSSGMTPLSALSMMIFVLLYLPCLATIAVIRR